jgi:hypothetical protein
MNQHHFPAMASWNSYTARLKPPCAIRISGGPRLFQ